MLKVIVLQNFATVGTPEDHNEAGKNNWSVAALSEKILDENRLNGLQQLSTRRLDVIIHNGSRFALLNLQAFKIFECGFATDTLKECVTHYIAPSGNLLYGMQSSGDVILLTNGLEKIKVMRKPAYIKIQQKARVKWYESLPLLPSLIEKFMGTRINSSSKSRSNQVTPVVYDAENPPINLWWESAAHYSEHLRAKFPYLTSLPDGFAVLCAFTPINCYIFVSSYETVLRDKSIANYRGSQIPGRWYRIIMHKSFVQKWLEDRRVVPWFEAKLCYALDRSGKPSISGGMLYAVMDGIRLELIYGVIKRRGEKFTLSWEIVKYDLDWALREPGMPYNLGSRFVVRFSSDCRKIAIVIGTHLGIYVHIQDVPFYPEDAVKLDRQLVALCNHSDYDGTHFYKSECWISDVQWLVEDAYIACLTLCGSLAIFYASGDPMVLKVRKPGAEPDEDKSARFFFPVFHPQMISKSSASAPVQVSGTSHHHQQNKLPSKGVATQYPTLKWIDSERILTCSSGRKVELFTIQRVLNVSTPVELVKVHDADAQADIVTSTSKTATKTETEASNISKEDSVTLLMKPVKRMEDHDPNRNAVSDDNNLAIIISESEEEGIEGQRAF